SAAENAAQVGRTLEVLLAESEGRKDGATRRVSGRAADNRLVHVSVPHDWDGPAPRPGDMVTAEVARSAPHHLIADSGPVGGTFEVRRTRSGDAYEQRLAGRERAERELAVVASGAS